MQVGFDLSVASTHSDHRVNRDLATFEAEPGAMDAENAPTAPWKSLRDFHKHPRLLFW